MYNIYSGNIINTLRYERKQNAYVVLLLECISYTFYAQNWPRGYKTFFMLKSVEYETLNAH